MNRCAVLLLCVLPGLSGAQQNPSPKPFSLTHVTVIDATGNPAQPDMTVVISGNRITALGKTGKVAIPKDAEVMDASGKFLIPGLWDMHVHVVGKEAFSLFLANGVTGIREMANYQQPLFGWRDEIAKGTLQGPRIVAAGLIVDGPQPIWPFSLSAGNEAEGREAVKSLKQRGSDFVKVYSKLPREAYFAIADEAKKQQMPFAGHVPISILVGEASDAGQKSIEHLTGITLGCSTKETELQKEAIDALQMPGAAPAKIFIFQIRVQVKALETFSEKKAADLFARFVKNGTWQCPTLTVLRSFAHLDDPHFANDDRLKYLSPFIKNLLYPKQPLGTPEDFASLKRLFQKNQELVGAMHRAKVEIISGTDCPNPYCFPGFSLHDELELLVKAGLTPMEALQSATRNPAKYLDKLKDLGTVEEGKIADLVLLEANPLEDIKNTKKIAAVIVAGKLLPKETLQKMLAEIEVGFQKK